MTSKSLEKHYVEKVFQTRFRDNEKLYKTNGKLIIPDVRNLLQKTLKNKWNSHEIQVEIGKWTSKSLEKHYLEKVFASRFRSDEKPYKTNGKSIF